MMKNGMHNTLQARIKRALPSAVVALSVITASSHSLATPPTMLSVTALPPLISNESVGDSPNILMILDNSNSMDEAPSGLAVGSDHDDSKSMIARGVIEAVIDDLPSDVRMGLMAYDQEDIDDKSLHASFYDVSYDPNNYDPNYTGSRDSLTKRFRTPNLSNSGSYIYYNVSLPFYSNSNEGSLYCYSTTADFDNGSEDTNSGPWDTYRCFRDKNSTSDAVPTWRNSSSESAAGYSNRDFESSLHPTDSDFAQNILDFGTFLTWDYVGPTWSSNSSPGEGMLYEPIAALDSSQKSALKSWLRKPTFNSSDDSKIRNAGLTPLEGTLKSALEYFNGTLSSSHFIDNNTVPAIPPNNCTNQDYVILVTDGMPSVDSSGNPISDTDAAITATAAKAAALLAAGVKTYVVGFALPTGVDSTLLDKIAQAGGTEKALQANDKDSLAATLSGIVFDILNRTSSASAASVVSNSSLGDGAVFQALYRPEITIGSDTAKWLGMLHAIFIDDQGRLREDTNGNDTLDSSRNVDRGIEFFYDTSFRRTRVRKVLEDGSVESVVEIEELTPIWDARDSLANFSSDPNDAVNVFTQRTYSSKAERGRYILTFVDGDKDGAVDAGEVVDFTAANFPAPVAGSSNHNYRWLDLPDSSAAPDLVNYIRGQENLAGYRNRTLDWDKDGTAEPWLLGDFVHSTPATVGTPADRYDLIYDDDTYKAFRQHYINRRQVVYIGANDGMLHAFNAGQYDTNTKKYETLYDFDGDGEKGDEVAHALGTELWAYIPQAALPHLKWLAREDYSHTYYVDGSPVAYDVNIFPDDADHPKGWGTILVVTMRFGGTDYPLDTTGDGSEDFTVRSSVIVLDVTNPEKPPTLLAEFSDEKLGYTLGRPAVVKRRAQKLDGAGLPSGTFENTATNDWYLVMGSGPHGPEGLDKAVSDQDAQLFVLDLKTMTEVSGFKPNPSGNDRDNELSSAPLSFTGDMTAMDWNNDYIDDAVYFGTAGGTPLAPTGSLKRLKLNSDLNFTTSSLGGSDSVNNLLTGSTQPFVAPPMVAKDRSGNRWIYVGSGRMLVAEDSQSTVQQTFYGIKEPFVDGAPSYAPVAKSSLADTTDTKVSVAGEVSGAPTIGGSAATTFNGLKSDIASISGWYTDFSTTRARISGAAAIAGVHLGYVEYRPSVNSCEPEGNSSLYVVHFQTGTASPQAALGETNDSINSYPVAAESVDLGQGMASGPVVHRSKAGNKFVTVSTTGVINVTQDQSSAVVNSGRQSWRELTVPF